MDRGSIVELVDAVASVEPCCRDRAVLSEALGSLVRLRSWMEACEIALAAQLADAAPWPEQAVAEASRSSLREAERVLARGRTTEAVHGLAEALDAGDVSGAHVDTIGRALRDLEPAQRIQLAEQAEWVVATATECTPAELDRTLKAEVRRLQADDGVARLERQRRATRLRTWIDDEGMWCLSGRFDPETGLKVSGRLSAAVERLFTDRTPAGCPTDPLERQGFLRAQALLHLIEQPDAFAPGRPEVVVVVDATAPEGPVVDWGLPVELPARVLHELFATADVQPVIIRNGVVLHASGQLDLGRTSRLANRAQRRALRALYATCAMPGCASRYDLCRLHHVTWWEHGGMTDVANLLPLCSRHHHAVHDQGWHVALGAGRELTITFPDGTQQTTGPPKRVGRCQPEVLAVAS